MNHDVIIIGGGFAGCSAALECARLGQKSVIIEFKAGLGGRATSYKVKEWPEFLDNGQHVVLGCCSETRNFFSALAPESIAWHGDLPIFSGDGPIRILKTWPLPAPFHLIPFLSGYPGLGIADKLRLAAGIFRLAAGSTNGRWIDTARAIGQTEPILRKFWEPILVSALNYNSDDSDTTHVRSIARNAFLGGRDGISIGIPRVPFSKIFNERIRPALEKAGTRFVMSKRVLRMSLHEHGGFIVHLHDQSAMTAKKVILATAPSAAKMIIEETTGIEGAAKPIESVLEGAPIISIHLLYDRPVTRLEFCQVQDRMIQWIFNKGTYNGQQHIQAVVSAADHYAAMTQTELVVAADMEVRAVLASEGSANAAQLIRGVSFVEKNATFAPRAGLVRPKMQPSPNPDLLLAGDYVDTGWPGTIESAVRSGKSAGAAAAKSLGQVLR